MGQFGGHFISVAQYQWCATQFDNIAFGTTSQAGHFITTAPRCETFHRHNVDHFIIAGIQQIIIWDEFRFTESETKFADISSLCLINSNPSWQKGEPREIPLW